MQGVMIVGVPRQGRTGDHRVALVPDTVPLLTRVGLEVVVERGAGAGAGFGDDDYQRRGATPVARAEVFGRAEVILQVDTWSADPTAPRADLEALRPGRAVIGLADPLGAGDRVAQMAGQGVTAFALELLPRISRAQSMDVLSSLAMIAGYKAVLLAADRLPRCMPLFMTAAGTLKPARVLVIGAGVAGLQAIATAKRLGAVVSAYDVRAEVAEQVASVGGEFVTLELEAADAADAGGYARAQSEAFYEQQRRLLGEVVADSDVVITTAAIPGRRSPLLVTAEAVRKMRSGSVIVDLAAARGGNCELSVADTETVESGVTILAPTDVPALVPQHTSQLYARNLASFLLHLCDGGALRLDPDDEITAATLLCRDGAVCHPRLVAPAKREVA
jgi:H+-translocating NAD(P) transhydrogenase subunit alpha